MPLTASSIVSQPENFSLRNGHAHMYAESKLQNFNITLFDQDIRVRAIPVSYLWKYGDGTSRTLAFPGGPVAERGPWTPIPGVANVPSEQVTMSVWRTKKILVAENCNRNADAPGCASLFDE